MNRSITRSITVLALAAWSANLGCGGSASTRPHDFPEEWVTLSFAGTVTDVRTRGKSSLPAHVSTGAAVEASFYFAPDAAKARDVRSLRSYDFPAGSPTGIVVQIGTTTWYVPLQRMNLRDDPNSGDAIGLAGNATMHWLFPHLLDRGSIAWTFSDHLPPYDMLGGVDLPESVSNLDFGAVDRAAGHISSSSADVQWVITFDLASMIGPE